MIVPILDVVFVSVSSINRSIDWYSRLLNLPIVSASHDGLIYNLPLSGTTGVILDAHGDTPIVASPKPLLMFSADDLPNAMTLARSISTEVSEPEDIGSVVVFYLHDPDGHKICIKVAKIPPR